MLKNGFEQAIANATVMGPKDFKPEPASRPRIHLPRLGWPESEFADRIGKILGPLEVIYRCDERVVEIDSEEFSCEFDRFKLARGGLKFKTLSAVRLKTWIEQFIETGVDVETKKNSGKLAENNGGSQRALVTGEPAVSTAYPAYRSNSRCSYSNSHSHRRHHSS